MNGLPVPCKRIWRSRGFTLIEMMIALVVLAILLMMGMPAFAIYIQNAKLRSTAESLQAGLQTARAEAVKRNAQIEFILTTDPGNSGSVATTNLSTTGQNWLIRYQDPATLLYSFIEGKVAEEGSGQGSTTTVVTTGTTSSITFNGFGGTTLGSAASFALTNPTGGLCKAAGGPMRCLTIVVSVGGQVRMCDPAVTTTGDTRKC